MALNSTMAPAAAEYGGDEISAIVLDPGYSTTRAGFAGEDVPKSVIPTHYGVLASDKGPKYMFGDNAINMPLSGLEIENPMSKDGTVDDWDTATKLWEYAITSRLTNNKPGDPRMNGLNDPDDEEMNGGMDGLDDEERPVIENPLLMTETGWNPPRAREKSIEIAMESWGTPAFWLAKNGVLSAYASGKHTALVVDVGASNVSVTPVHDGMILKKGITRSPLAGNFVSSQTRLLFSACTPPITVTPHYLIDSKIAVDANQPPQASLKIWRPGTEPRSSYRAYQEERVLHEFKESVVSVWPGPAKLSSLTPDDIAMKIAPRPFELPDGYNQLFSSERPKPVEALFDAKSVLPDPYQPLPTVTQTIPDLIRQSISAVDVDIRPLLLSHVIVVGGGSLVHGFTDRLNNELQIMFPSLRSRVQASGMTVERRFASWIGGSILASLGTFHQMWISRKEYEEHGAAIVEKRCK